MDCTEKQSLLDNNRLSIDLIIIQIYIIMILWVISTQVKLNLIPYYKNKNIKVATYDVYFVMKI
jgi:heme/copper-type cytochrome/quinol oxidase subunit 2